MVASIDKIETSPELPPGCSLENWHDAIRLREAYGWRKDIDCWVPHSVPDTSGFIKPRDLIAVSVQGLLHPRQLVALGKTDGALGRVGVYLGLLSEAVVFCDRLADPDSPDKLLLDAIPISKLAYVARIIGVTAVGEPFRDVQTWQFAEHELALVEKLLRETPELISVSLQAFDNGGLHRVPLPPRIEGGNSVH